jgi:hypothetical protein
MAAIESESGCINLGPSKLPRTPLPTAKDVANRRITYLKLKFGFANCGANRPIFSATSQANHCQPFANRLAN